MIINRSFLGFELLYDLNADVKMFRSLIKPENMKKYRPGMTRRRFIQRTSGALAAISAAGFITSLDNIPEINSNKTRIMRRKLGKTGLEVSLLSFGGGSQFLRNPDGTWEKMLETAIAGGINVFDTAPNYVASKMNIGDGKSVDSSQDRYGQVLPKYRKQIILSTKLDSRKPDEARVEFETSLKKLKTDYVDILFIHGIEIEDNISDIEAGVYKTLVSLKDSGAVKYIGFSSMGDARHATELLDKLDFDVVLLAMNATQYGNFARFALPVAMKKGTGVIAMKLMRDIVGKEAAPHELLNYALTQEGVATALIGHTGADTLAENIRLVQEFSAEAFPLAKRKELETRLSHLANPHAFCWAQPGYKDGGVPGDYNTNTIT
jgi:aryl-alcohol dehydrogenase-like predicted oxidoreductase